MVKTTAFLVALLSIGSAVEATKRPTGPTGRKADTTVGAPNLSAYRYVRVGPFSGGPGRLGEKLTTAFWGEIALLDCLLAYTDTSAVDSLVVIEGEVKRYWPGGSFGNLFGPLGRMAPPDTMHIRLPDLTGLLEHSRLVVRVRLRDASTGAELWTQDVSAVGASPVIPLAEEIASKGVRLIGVGCVDVSP